MLYFISSNKWKILNAQHYLQQLNISFQIRDLPITEIQADSIEDIVLHKAEQAYSLLQEPLLITDHGWFIHGLKGFPGPYMKYINEWFTPQNFLELTQNLKDRNVTLQEIVCYKDQTSQKIFKQEHAGELLNEIRGEGYPAMTIISFIKGMSNAEARNKGISPVDSSTLWREFATWYKEIKNND